MNLKPFDRVQFRRTTTDGTCAIGKERKAMVLAVNKYSVILAFALPLRCQYRNVDPKTLTINLAGFKFCRKFSKAWLETQVKVIEEATDGSPNTTVY